MNTLFHLFDFLVDIFFVIQCDYELDNSHGRKPKAEGKNRLTEEFDDVIGEIVFYGILAYGIYKDWIKMPEPYIGDGYNFGSRGW